MRRKNAQLVAEAVSVVCPHCSADVPDPDHGSLFWTKEQIARNGGLWLAVCTACDGPIRIVSGNKARFE